MVIASFKRLERQLIRAFKTPAADQERVLVSEAGRLFWTMFTELSNARTMGPAGPNPIQFSEIESWARLNRWPLEPRHVQLIRAMDDAWIEGVYAKRDSEAPSAPATPANLDAAFSAAGW